MIIINGYKNQGKTTQVKRFIDFFHKKKKSFAGFYSEKVIKDNNIVGYDIVTIPDKEKFKFLRMIGSEKQQRIGPFYIDDFALAEGVIQIKKAIINQVDYLIIDEVGKLELTNKGWYAALERALSQFKGEIILAVRTEFVEKVIQKWQLKNVQILGTSDIEFSAFINKKDNIFSTN
jgi:nucleoside-triphosphatase THEP1